MKNRKELLGKKVVCINDNFSNLNSDQLNTIPNRPVKDSIYTIRDAFKTHNGYAYHLVEITNPKLEHPSGLGTFEPSFNQIRFSDPINDGRIFSFEESEESKVNEEERELV